MLRAHYCHLHPLQAANCYRNSRLVVDENDTRVKMSGDVLAMKRRSDDVLVAVGASVGSVVPRKNTHAMFAKLRRAFGEESPMHRRILGDTSGNIRGLIGATSANS